MKKFPVSSQVPNHDPMKHDLRIISLNTIGEFEKNLYRFNNPSRESLMPRGHNIVDQAIYLGG